MGYFSNNDEADRWQAQWCARCVHEPITSETDCPIRQAHWLYGYDAYKEGGMTKAVLDLLIPKYGAQNERCAMFIEREVKDDATQA